MLTFSSTSAVSAPNRVNVLIVGTGEYTTGYLGAKTPISDKAAGVVGYVALLEHITS